MIDQLQGSYRWLSNFWTCLLNVDNFVYTSSEVYFQAMKMRFYRDMRRVARTARPGEAKHLGQQLEARPDWLIVRDQVMLKGLRNKFRIPGLRKRLVATGDEVLVEGNYWNDKYWGICLKTQVGENRLGQLLMQVRSELQADLPYQDIPIPLADGIPDSTVVRLAISEYLAATDEQEPLARDILCRFLDRYRAEPPLEEI